jgi:hypothetical protein
MAESTQKKPARAARSRKPGETEKRIARPLTAEALAAYGELTTAPPTSDFRPDGQWEQSFRIWMTGGAWDSYQGCVTLKRSPAGNDEFRLDVLESLIMPRTRSIHETKATARCRCDTLATPVSWRLISRVYDAKTEEEFSEARLEQKGRADAEQIVIETNGREKTAAAPAAWTWNWALFEAVQRKPSAQHCAADFALLDDLDIMKAGQRLFSRGETAIQFVGLGTPVWRYDQIGQGLLPTRYYIDQAGRLLLAHTELRAYILDARVHRTHAQKLKWLAAKEMK